jgi:hypothetical protein
LAAISQRAADASAPSSARPLFVVDSTRNPHCARCICARAGPEEGSWAASPTRWCSSGSYRICSRIACNASASAGHYRTLCPIRAILGMAWEESTDGETVDLPPFRRRGWDGRGRVGPGLEAGGRPRPRTISDASDRYGRFTAVINDRAAAARIRHCVMEPSPCPIPIRFRSLHLGHTPPMETIPGASSSIESAHLPFTKSCDGSMPSRSSLG